MYYIYYTFLTFFLFSIFFVLISIFGVIFLKLIKKIDKKKWDLNFLEFSFLAFGIGMVIFIIYCYIIACFNLMNYNTIILPLLIIDTIYILVNVYMKRITTETISKFWKSIKSLFSKRENQVLIIIFTLFFFLQLIFLWEIITSNLALIRFDPYDYFERTSLLIDTGEFSKHGPKYPQGMRIFCYACLLLVISPDFNTRYFFFKFGPIPFSFFYMLITVILIKRIFKNNFYVFFCLLAILSCNYLNGRIIIFLASNMATLIVLISIIVLISKIPLYIEGFFVTLIYLMNPIVSFYFNIAFILFLLLKFFYLDGEYRKHIINILITILFVFIFLVPYFIYMQLHDWSIFLIIEKYLEKFSLTLKLNINEKNNSLSLILINFNESIREFLSEWYSPKKPILKTELKYNNLIYSYFFILAISSLLISIKHNSISNSNNLLIFGKMVVLIILAFFFIPIIYPNFILVNIMDSSFINRLLECFAGPVIIMECISINYIVNKARNLTIYYSHKSKYYRNVIKNRILSQFLSFDRLLILVLLISSFSAYQINKEKNYYELERYYRFNDEEMEIIFYIIDKIPSDSKMLVQEFWKKPGDNVLYLLLYDYEYDLWNFTSKKAYENSILYLSTNNFDYILLYIKYTFSKQLNFFLNDSTNFKLLFINSYCYFLEVSSSIIINSR